MAAAHATARLRGTFFGDSHFMGLRSGIELEFFENSESWIDLIVLFFLKKIG
jgi:hypothetical protein